MSRRLDGRTVVVGVSGGIALLSHATAAPAIAMRAWAVPPGWRHVAARGQTRRAYTARSNVSFRPMRPVSVTISARLAR